LKQFETLDANESRQVTRVRWIVEAANGKLKNMFHFFDGVVSNSYLPNIDRYLRICCAIINAFTSPIFSGSSEHDELVQIALDRLEKPNTLQEELEASGLVNKRAVWCEADENSVQEFPELSLDDLKNLTVGVYQIEMGSRYADHHMRDCSKFTICYHKERDDLIRVKLRSRFSRSNKHTLWIQFQPNGTGNDSITGWFCQCKTGARTLGCCSHIACVLWYMGFARHNKDNLPKRRDVCGGLLDACAHLAEVDSDEDEQD
jgi:hypothetical protein